MSEIVPKSYFPEMHWPRIMEKNRMVDDKQGRKILQFPWYQEKILEDFHHFGLKLAKISKIGRKILEISDLTTVPLAILAATTSLSSFRNNCGYEN